MFRRRPNSPTARDTFGTLAYNAPEVHSGAESRLFDKCDVFSLGCTLFLMVFKQLPFKLARREDYMYSMLQSKSKDGYWKEFKRGMVVSEELKGTLSSPDLISRLLDREPLNRISLESIMSHPWMKLKPFLLDQAVNEELLSIFSEVSENFKEKAMQEIRRKDWSKNKGFLARRSRPGSACDYKKEINEFLFKSQQEIDQLLHRFKRTPLRKITEDREELGRYFEDSFAKAESPITATYSVTGRLRKLSSSSSNNSEKS